MASLIPCRFSCKASSNSSSESHFRSRSFVLAVQINRRTAPISIKNESSDSNPKYATGKELGGLTRLNSVPISIKSEADVILNYSGDEGSSGFIRKETLKSKLGDRKRSTWRRIIFASTRVRSIIMLNILTVIYASDIPVLKEVEAVMDPATFNAARFVISAIPFIPFVIGARGDEKTRNAGMELGVWISLAYLMQSIGLLTSDAGRASFISMFTVIVVALIDGLLGAVVPAHTCFGALMSIIGVVMLESSGSPPCVGDLLNFLSAVFFGIHMLRTEHISRNISREKFLPLLGNEICVVAVVSTMWYLSSAWFSGSQVPNASPWTWTEFFDAMVAFPWIPALYTGVLSTGLCLWIEMSAMCDISATETAIVYGMEPVWGAGFAWFLLGERWGTMGWIGAALVLSGSLTVQIFGSLSPTSDSNKRIELDNKKSNISVSSGSQKGPISSPIVVSTAESGIQHLKNK